MAGGTSVRLNDTKQVSISQNLKLKPNTDYVLTYYLRMQDVASGGPGSRFIVYVNEGSGRHIILPRKTAMRGTCPWTRFECHFSTSADVGKKSGQTISFQFIKMKGTAWLDHVELCEVQK